MVNDPVGDMLIQIKNAYMAGKFTVVIPHSKVKEAVARILAQENYLGASQVQGEHLQKTLHLALRYEDSGPAMTDLKRKSKPGLRLYVGWNDIQSVVGGMGIAILSTPQGIMTGKEAKNRRIGGELLCEVW